MQSMSKMSKKILNLVPQVIPWAPGKDIPVASYKDGTHMTFLTSPMSPNSPPPVEVEFEYIQSRSKQFTPNEVDVAEQFLLKNRFRNILAPNHTRIKLSTHDYINANYIT